MARSFGQLTITSLKRGEVEQVARVTGGLRHTLALSWDEKNDLFLVTYLKADGTSPIYQSMHWYENVDHARHRFDLQAKSF